MRALAKTLCVRTQAARSRSLGHDIDVRTAQQGPTGAYAWEMIYNCLLCMPASKCARKEQLQVLSHAADSHVTNAKDSGRCNPRAQAQLKPLITGIDI